MTAEPVESEPILRRVARFRKAARIAVDSPAPLRDRLLALMDLMSMVREEPDPLIRHWGELAVWEECKSLVGMDDASIAPVPANYEATQRQLRQKGLTQCPTCRSALATDVDLDRWSRMRRAEGERLEARDRAVQS